MKGIYAALAVLAALSLSACARPQPSPTNHVVTWTATVPALDVSAGSYSFNVYTAAVAAASSACPAAGTYGTTATCTAANTVCTAASGGNQTCSCTQTNVAGTFQCGVAVVIQGGATSPPSNVSGPVTVPASPTAPALASPTVADMIKPALPAIEMQAPAYVLAKNVLPLMGFHAVVTPTK